MNVELSKFCVCGCVSKKSASPGLHVPVGESSLQPYMRASLCTLPFLGPVTEPSMRSQLVIVPLRLLIERDAVRNFEIRRIEIPSTPGVAL